MKTATVVLSTGETATYQDGRCTSVHAVSWSKLTPGDYAKCVAAATATAPMGGN